MDNRKYTITFKWPGWTMPLDIILVPVIGISLVIAGWVKTIYNWFK